MRKVCISSSKEDKKELDNVVAKMMLSGFELEEYSENVLSVTAVLRYQADSSVEVPDLTVLIQQGSLINFY